MKKLNILFLGTDKFSVPFLYHLYYHRKFNVVGIVTKTPKSVGRGGVVVPNVVSKHADKLGIKKHEISSFGDDKHQLPIDWLGIDYVVVVSFAYIIPTSILKNKSDRFINVHPSLLPKYRGPSPIESVLVDGKQQTGVSIMLLDSGMDTGPILAQKSLPIKPGVNVDTLSKNLIDLSLDLLTDSIIRYDAGQISAVPQKTKGVTITKKIRKEDGFVTLKEDPTHIFNKYRAYCNWPGIYTKVHYLEEFLGIKTKIHNKQEIIKLNQILINNSQELKIVKLQLPNKPVISVQDFLNGYSI